MTSLLKKKEDLWDLKYGLEHHSIMEQLSVTISTLNYPGTKNICHQSEKD